MLDSLTMPRRLPPGCVEDRDRHGNIRVYFRAKNCAKVRIRAEPWTAEFMEHYAVAKRDAAPIRGKDIIPATWRWLCVKYFAECTDYLRASDRTKYVRRGVLEGTFDEPIAPGSPRFFRDMPLSNMTADAIEVLRDRKIDFPEGANNRVKAIRQVFKWAARKRGPDGKPLVPSNPAREVPYFKSNNPSGYYTWTIEEVQQFEQRHPIGTRARLALALLLFTGGRRSDVTKFGPRHARDGRLTFTVFKGRNQKPKVLVLPILPELQRVIDASPCGTETFLVTAHGKPFTDAGFGNWFGDRCTEAGVPGRAHGLRKAGATIAATNGATAHQLMAIFGWDTLKMAEAYTRKADQRRLAASAMHMLAFGPSAPIGSPTESPEKVPPSENATKSMPYFTAGAQERTRTSTAFTTGT
jgi:integrase